MARVSISAPAASRSPNLKLSCVLPRHHSLLHATLPEGPHLWLTAAHLPERQCVAAAGPD